MNGRKKQGADLHQAQPQPVERCFPNPQEGLSNEFLTLPKVRPGVESTWHQFVIHSPHRDALKAWLLENGIGSEIHYPIPPHLSEEKRPRGAQPADVQRTARGRAGLRDRHHQPLPPVKESHGYVSPLALRPFVG